ncbi:hypothetical protein RJ639_008754 [Escallonia herrerae]|uniref:Alcohol dehydrogenase-like C-terminal domain-containing protein n=1 Tax=Escallonia herrerae TaxID=1293975 RepID=A0AA89ASL1_9ASTE|nr:hypothetical protein RJ639_008754 [Escallonia herrerae]
MIHLYAGLTDGRVCNMAPSLGGFCGLGAAWKVANVSEGSTVVIFGLGTVGLSVAQGAKMRGASRIIGVDTNPEKSEKAKVFGITDFINPNDCNEPIQQGWGLAVTLGVPNTKPEIAAHYGLFLSGRTLRGSLFGGWKPKSDLPQLVGMYLRKELQIDEFVTHNLPFEEINKAFDLMTAGNQIQESTAQLGSDHEGYVRFGVVLSSPLAILGMSRSELLKHEVTI